MTHQNPDTTIESIEERIGRSIDNIDRRSDAMEATLNRLNDDIRAHRQAIHLDNKATARSTYAVSVALIIASILLLVSTG